MKRIFKWIVLGYGVLVGLTLLLFVALVILRLAGVIETDGPTTSDAVSMESTDLPTESVVSTPTAEQDTEVSGTGSTLREFLAATLTAAVATEPVPVQQLAPQQPEPPTATPALPTWMPAPPTSAPMQPSDPTVNSQANLRTGPGTNYEIVGSAQPGLALDVAALLRVPVVA